MTNRKVIIAGGSGFIGSAIANALHNRGDEVVVLTRSPSQWHGAGRAVPWDGKTLGDWCREVDGAHAVINLAGKNVNCRYTRKNLNEIDQSRVDVVTAMGKAIVRSSKPPGVLIQASTTAIYGDRGETWCDESSELGTGIPVQTASAWEAAFDQNPTPQTRRVILRISFALGRQGGVLGTLATFARCYLGGTIGSGRQYISWVHIDDLVAVVLRAMDDDQMSSLYVVATPNPVTNALFMQELRKTLHRPWSPRVPAICVRLGCFILRTEPVLALTGRRVPKRLNEIGFEFKFPDLRPALENILCSPVPSRPVAAGGGSS